MKHPVLIVGLAIGVIGIIAARLMQSSLYSTSPQFEMELSSRPSGWNRGITGIALKNAEGRQDFKTVYISDASRATKLVGKLRTAFFDHEYPVEHSDELSGFRQVSSWLLQIKSQHKGTVTWNIKVLTHTESQRQLLQIHYSRTGSFRCCEIPTRGPWREWLVD